MSGESATEVVFERGGWWPRVVRHGKRLRLEVVGGADALHQPRISARRRGRRLMRPGARALAAAGEARGDIVGR